VEKVLAGINAERAKTGLKALTVDAKLVSVAQANSDKQASQRRTSTDSKASSKITPGWKAFGQTVASTKTPELAVSGWLRSSTSKKKLLNKEYTAIGVAVAYDSRGAAYYTALFAGYAPASPSPTATPKPTASATPTATPKPTASATPTATPKPTASATPTATPKPTASPTATPKPTITPTPSPTPTTPASSAAVAKILADTNAYRAAAGVPALKLDERINAVAQKWSEVQAAEKRMYHNPSYAQQMPAGWRGAAENVAYGYSLDSVVKAWYDSPGHRTNMLNGSYTHIGIGVAFDSNGRPYYTQNFGEYR
jgi:uncharacterized protein YkwD